MKYSCEELKALIDYTQSAYIQVSDEWEQIRDTDINLKKRKIDSVEMCGEVHNYIVDYVKLLERKYYEIASGLNDLCDDTINMRIKSSNSIEYKILLYKNEDHDHGKIPINKCLNDLLGLRIILSEPLSAAQVFAFVDEYYPEKYRRIDSSKGNYKATHLYFREDNFTFPWELQIWNACDARNNLASHKKYKQGYTIWEKKQKGEGVNE